MTAEALMDQQTGVRKVLVVDDQQDVREALRLLLKGSGYRTEEVGSPNAALETAAYGDHDLIVVDMNYTWDTTSGEEGLRLLDRLRAQRPETPVIAMTGWSTIELAVEAMHHGACDFIPKPWDNRHFLSIVKKHIDASPEERRPRDAELAIARKVQRKLLPEPRFSTCGLDCECASLPAGDVSGDLYDFLPIDGDSMAFVLGDVCGKGIGAALLVANLLATLRSLEELARHPSRLMDRVNRLFFQSTRPEHFATLFYGVYEAGGRRIRYVNCGHPPPVILRSDNSFELLEASATVLGAFKERGFQEASVSLGRDDQLVVYSDGFSEANLEDENGTWAVETIRRLGSVKSVGLAGTLANEAASLGPQLDDITVMSLRPSATN
ncbi:MAG TPA: SpoIIE family protein phosphatase [Bryobacteraceae bacterium]|nr:SpoIIE family protein phosphatase [Bryobacteraceae bacterium]